MTRKEELKDLLEIIKYDLDTDHHYAAVFPCGSTWRSAAKASLGSMDAALALLGGVLPGWVIERMTMWNGSTVKLCQTDNDGWYSFNEGHKQSLASADIPARALLIAILKALVEMKEG